MYVPSVLLSLGLNPVCLDSQGDSICEVYRNYAPKCSCDYRDWRMSQCCELTAPVDDCQADSCISPAIFNSSDGINVCCDKEDVSECQCLDIQRKDHVDCCSFQHVLHAQAFVASTQALRLSETAFRRQSHSRRSVKVFVSNTHAQATFYKAVPSRSRSLVSRH